MPIRGFYQMKLIGDEARLLIQLKLDPALENNLSSCRVIIPFFGRPPIRVLSGAPTAGECLVREDGAALVWEVGNKFAGRNLEVALRASVGFAPAGSAPPTPMPNEVSFFAQISPLLNLT